MPTLEQQRARDAWEKSGQGVRRHGKEYVNLSKSLPALVMNSGLMQVMAFLHQKGAGVHQAVATDLRAWLHQRFGNDSPAEFEHFMNAMLAAEPHHFRNVTTEAFAWLKWLRQMAAARQGAVPSRQAPRQRGA